MHGTSIIPDLNSKLYPAVAEINAENQHPRTIPLAMILYSGPAVRMSGKMWRVVNLDGKCVRHRKEGSPTNAAMPGGVRGSCKGHRDKKAPISARWLLEA